MECMNAAMDTILEFLFYNIVISYHEIYIKIALEINFLMILKGMNESCN